MPYFTHVPNKAMAFSGRNEKNVAFRMTWGKFPAPWTDST